MDRLTSMTAFTTVVSSGSFAEAARRLNMSPATMTAHIQTLEERLGARLLNRTTRRLSLTEAGKAYHDSCTQILALLEEADNVVSALQSTPRGTLRINVAAALVPRLTALVNDFSAGHPDITIDLLATDRLPDLVEDGIDVAIQRGQPPDSSLIVRRLGGYRLVLCAAPAYLQARGEPREPGDLANHNCISYMHYGFVELTRQWTLHGPEGEISVAISGDLHSNSPDMLRAAALAGRGITMVPSFLFAEAGGPSTLRRILVDYHAGEQPIVAVYPHRQHMSAKVRSFIDFAARQIAADPRWQAAPES
jgi:DNA-binding transcriptional LysR family regulator